MKSLHKHLAMNIPETVNTNSLPITYYAAIISNLFLPSSENRNRNMIRSFQGHPISFKPLRHTPHRSHNAQYDLPQFLLPSHPCPLYSKFSKFLNLMLPVSTYRIVLR